MEYPEVLILMQMVLDGGKAVAQSLLSHLKKQRKIKIIFMPLLKDGQSTRMGSRTV